MLKFWRSTSITAFGNSEWCAGLGQRNHVFDSASVFLCKKDLYSKEKRPKQQEIGQIPDCSFYLPVSVSQNEPVIAEF